MDTPVLLIVWRRPDTLRQLIDAIRPVAPSRIFIACDGPNPINKYEAQKVVETRAVIDNEIDWCCDVKRLYSDVNHGCRLGVSRAITWFFQQVDSGIILEDDCIPHPDFFNFCTVLLDRFRTDTRVWCISGNNFQDGRWRGDGSYYFSRYNHCWGWATWRRCWNNFDSDLSLLPALSESSLISSIFDDPVERKYWIDIWQRLLSTGIPDSWAYRWTFTCLINGGLTALPNHNLISNIGFGEDATHTTTNFVNTSINKGINPIIHPTFVLRDVIADRYTFNHTFKGKWLRFPLSLLLYIKRAIFPSLQFCFSKFAQYFVKLLGRYYPLSAFNRH